jgi:hypothetical protein
MGEQIVRPRDLQINAWTGDGSPYQQLPTLTPWAQMENLAGTTQWLGPPLSVDERDWTHPEVGWGVVLPDNDGVPATERCRADDKPEIHRLLQKRPDAPVLRWRKELQQGFLRRYYPDGTSHDLSAQAPNPGVGKGRIPRYLLIYASPAEIPWAVQYALNMSTFVGRLDLTGPGLDNYIDSLIDDWAGQACDPRAPLVWSVDHGPNDITWLMARAVAGKIWAKLENNVDLSRRLRLMGASATREQLGNAPRGTFARACRHDEPRNDRAT